MISKRYKQLLVKDEGGRQLFCSNFLLIFSQGFAFPEQKVGAKTLTKKEDVEPTSSWLSRMKGINNSQQDAGSTSSSIFRSLLSGLFVLFIAYNLLASFSYAESIEPKSGVRPLGMSAFSAVADDINAISWNPAGLSLIQNQEATMTYAPLYAGINQSYLAYAYPFGKWGSVGLDFSYLNYGNMDWRDDSGRDLGDFSRKDYSIYASYGINLMDSLSLGLSLGTTSLKITSSDESATGIGIDMGALYNIGSRASLGLSLENIGGVSASDKDIARQKIKLGAACSLINNPNNGLIIALDIEEQQKKLDTIYSGVEWSVFTPSSFFVKRKIQERYNAIGRYKDMADYTEGLPEKKGKASLYIRGGMKKRLSVDEPMAFSGGFCVKYAVIPKKMTLKLEHAFAWHPYLETTQRLSLGLEFGKMMYD